MIRSAITRRPKRWRGLSEEVKNTIIDDCVWARTQARENLAHTDLPGAIDRVLSAAKTLTLIEGQNQRDELAEVEAQKPGVQVNVQNNQVIKVEFDRGG